MFRLMRTLRTPTLLSVLLLILMAAAAFGQDAESANLRDGVAIQGYDPVAYFTENAAVLGNSELASTYRGVTYHFSSEEHLALFQADPERYVPAYGGWCAWAAAQNYLATIDPAAFVIHEDTLYLNFSRGVNNRFRRRIDDNIEQADDNWPGLANQARSR